MTQTHRPGVTFSARQGSSAEPAGSFARQDRRPHGAFPLSRRYEAACLGRDGSLIHIGRVSPAHPLVDEAFGAFARGSLFATPSGPVAVEDLAPGTELLTESHGRRRLLWIGRMQPGAGEGGIQLLRIAADTFGLDRPMPDLLLGPAARLLQRVPAAAGGQALVPAGDFLDGESVVAIRPLASMELYHLVFDTQVVLRVNGIETESYHPGQSLGGYRDAETIGMFLQFFPHARDLGDFGRLAHPRLAPGEFDPTRAA